MRSMGLRVIGSFLLGFVTMAAGAQQPPSAWYAEIRYERPNEPIAEGYTAIHQGPASRERAMEDAQHSVRDGACLRSEHDLEGATVYIDPPLCIPAARIVSARAVPYEEPH